MKTAGDPTWNTDGNDRLVLSSIIRYCLTCGRRMRYPGDAKSIGGAGLLSAKSVRHAREGLCEVCVGEGKTVPEVRAYTPDEAAVVRLFERECSDPDDLAEMLAMLGLSA